MNPSIPDIYAADSDPVKVGLCQVFTEPWAVEENLERTCKALQDAARQGAEIAITPECVLHGYAASSDPDDTRRQCAEIAEPIGGPRIGAVRQLAQETRMHIVFGFAERGDDGRLFNSAAVILSTGEIADVYRKVHCRNFEDVRFSGAFTPGDRFVATDLACRAGPVRMGTMICFDREIPESVRCLRAMGSQLVACPLATRTFPLGEAVNYAHNETITRARAAENELFIAVVNHAGQSNGGSFVVGPGGEALVQLGEQPEARVVDLPVGALAETIHGDRYGWMGWGYRRPDVYDRHLR